MLLLLSPRSQIIIVFNVPKSQNHQAWVMGTQEHWRPSDIPGDSRCSRTQPCMVRGKARRRNIGRRIDN